LKEILKKSKKVCHLKPHCLVLYTKHSTKRF